MTYEEFKNKYNNQYLDWDGAYGPQCWDLAQIYVTECLGLPSWVLSGCKVAKNLLIAPKRNDLDTYFKEIPTTEMCPGDICIWDNNDAGHIAIFDHWDGSQNWYFSQNPGVSKVRTCEGIGKLHAFRLKKEEPPKPEPTQPVERDESKTQVEVIVDNLRIRVLPSTNGEIVGIAKQGIYNILEIANADGYTWYKIADSQWIAYSPEWENILPVEEKEEYIQFKVLSKKDGYVEIDLGKVYIKE